MNLRKEMQASIYWIRLPSPAQSCPYQQRLADFETAMPDVYDFFYDVNKPLSRFFLAGQQFVERLQGPLSRGSCHM